MTNLAKTSNKLILFFMLCGIISSPIYAEHTEDVFTDLYNSKHWGSGENGGTSGDGSMLETTQEYRKLLQDFLRTFNIQSVIDVGCGDWQFSQTIDWSGIQYTGYDVVQSVIQRNQEKFQAPNLTFIHGNALLFDLPSADLLICKDVLQHLPNEDVFLLLTQCPKFKFCLITNDVDPDTLSSNNHSIQKGACRTLDLTRPPFSMQGAKVLTYSTAHEKNPHPTIKQVFLICNNN
jgi:SAM-dependent methyltransferase